ncbi:hypothetical protein QTP86_004823 [Hemibagrus guttatus]|nr:hypothetical protein QTP86_004823 [Hemibagrus guttatus]
MLQRRGKWGEARNKGEANGGSEDQGKASRGSEKQKRDTWGEHGARRQGQRVPRDVHNRAEAPSDVHGRAAEPNDVHHRAAGPSDVHRRASVPSDVHRRTIALNDDPRPAGAGNSPRGRRVGDSYIQMISPANPKLLLGEKGRGRGLPYTLFLRTCDLADTHYTMERRDRRAHGFGVAGRRPLCRSLRRCFESARLLRFVAELSRFLSDVLDNLPALAEASPLRSGPDDVPDPGDVPDMLNPDDLCIYNKLFTKPSEFQNTVSAQEILLVMHPKFTAAKDAVSSKSSVKPVLKDTADADLYEKVKKLSEMGSNKRRAEELIIPFWRDYLQDVEEVFFVDEVKTQGSLWCTEFLKNVSLPLYP